MSPNITLQLLESITHNDIIKTLRGKKDYAISEINVFSVKGPSFFPGRQREERKIFLYREIDVCKKSHMSLKYQNRQYKLAIWSSMFVFNRQFPSVAGFLLLFHPTKRWKISHHIVMFTVVILSRFQCYIPHSFKLMILSLYSSTICQKSRLIQIFCRPERKSLHFVLPWVFLRQFQETWMACEKIVC